MPIRVLLVNNGQIVTLPDPSGGMFDAAGDFDRLLPMENQLPVQASPKLSALARIEAYVDVEFSPNEMVAVAQDVAVLLHLAKPGPEARGLDRLRVMAEHCATMPNSVLRVQSD